MPSESQESPDPAPTAHRVYGLPEPLRAAVHGRRQALGQTLRSFLAEAIGRELPQGNRILIR